MRTLLLALCALSLALGLFLCSALPVAAFDINNPTINTNNPGNGTTPICSTPGATNSVYCKESGNSSDTLTGTNGAILTAVNIISLAAGVAALIYIIIGALRLILSAGNANNVSAARNMILYALIGLAVIASSQALTRFILDRISV